MTTTIHGRSSIKTRKQLMMMTFLLIIIILIINLMLSSSVKSDDEVNRVDKNHRSNNVQYRTFSSSTGTILAPPRTLTETTQDDHHNNTTVPNARIVDGCDVTDYSTASFFVRPANLNKVCGGALIHNDMIVTAAHCVEAFQQKGVLVYNPRTKDYTTRIDIDWYNIHPNHSSQQPQQQRTPPLTTHDKDSATTTTTTPTEPRTNNNNNNGNTSPPSVNFDFAIMRLSRPVVVATQSSSSIQPIPINIDPTIPTSNQPLQAFGFGRVEADNPTKRPSRLQVGDFHAISNDECRSRVKHMTPDVRNAIQEDILCVDPLSESDQHKQSSVCRGDSGGPLITFDDDDRMSSPVLIGLVVFGHGCIADRIPDGFARISYYADYIMDHLCSMSRVSHVDCPDDNDNNNYLDGSTTTKQPTNRPSSIAHPSPKPSSQSMYPSNYPSSPPSILLPTNIPTIDATPVITLSPSNDVNADADADTILSLSKNPSRGNDGRLSGKIGGGYIRNDRPRPRTPSQSSTTISPTTTEEERNGNDDHGG